MPHGRPEICIRKLQSMMRTRCRNLPTTCETILTKMFHEQQCSRWGTDSWNKQWQQGGRKEIRQCMEHKYTKNAKVNMSLKYDEEKI